MTLLVTNVKKRKRMVLLPVFVIGVFVPLLCRHYTIYFADYPAEMLQNTLTLLHTCMPMLVSWWVVLLYQDFFSWEGNELLYYYYSQMELLKAYASVLVLYGILESAVFAAVSRMIDMPVFVLGQLLCETLCVAALTYFCAFLFLNTGGSLLIAASYCIYINMFDKLNLFGFLSIFPRADEFLVWDGGCIRNVVTIAVILDVAGILCMRFRRRYR